jgi:hypothetical protein
MLRPVAALVFVAGWAVAIISFFAIGTETCVTTQVPLVGGIETCQDTTSTAIIIVVAIGFGSTIAAVLLFALSHVLSVIEGIEANTRRGD